MNICLDTKVGRGTHRIAVDCGSRPPLKSLCPRRSNNWKISTRRFTAKPIWLSLKIIRPVACWAALKWWTFCHRKSIGFSMLMEKANRRTSLSARIPTNYLLNFPTKANTKFVSFQIFLILTW